MGPGDRPPDSENPPMPVIPPTSRSGKLLGVVPGQIDPESGIVLVVKQKDKPGEFILEQLKQDGTFDNPDHSLRHGPCLL